MLRREAANETVRTKYGTVNNISDCFLRYVPCYRIENSVSHDLRHSGPSGYHNMLKIPFIPRERKAGYSDSLRDRKLA